MIREVLIVAIEVTSVLILASVLLYISLAYEQGNDFIIEGSKGRRLSWLAKLIDGFKNTKAY